MDLENPADALAQAGIDRSLCSPKSDLTVGNYPGRQKIEALQKCSRHE